MQRLPGRRETKPGIPEFLNHRLNSYALAASAAGVSLLALPRPAEAEIVFTPAHIFVRFPDTVILDIDNDGIPDFEFFHSGGDGINRSTLNIGAASVNARVAARSSCTGSHTTYCPTYALALHRGETVGLGRPFKIIATVEHAVKVGSHYYSFGRWGNVRNRYLGLKHTIDGQTHYGWARMSVQVQGASVTALVTGYAYETIPNRSIRMGQKPGDMDTSASDATPADPGSLGALAQGSQGLQKWRRLHQQ